ncbi:MAG: thioredoxin fold domain-containing protein [Gammaproteobacteria bacterium]|nr:thioredoxin fold domain-containing protein [Gammaproteobacteria bacterium]
MSRRFRSILSAISLILLILSGAGTQASTTRGKVTGGQMSEHPPWFKESFLDIAEDVSEAGESDKHVLLFLHLNGCPYCHKMIEENFKHAPHTGFLRENFDVIAINIKGDREIAFDQNTLLTEKQLADLLKVRATPTIIFLDPANKPVARLNGYRSVSAFKTALNYVAEKAYTRVSLTGYAQEQHPSSQYVFRDHPQIQNIDNLKSVADRPLAVIFEDSTCDACNALYEGHLSNPETNNILKDFTLVRLNARSDSPITDVEGNPTTPRAYALKLGLSYRPGIVLFDRGREITRIDGLLYTYHFQELLRYVGERHYEKYPDSFFDYLRVRSDEILRSGKNIDLSS